MIKSSRSSWTAEVQEASLGYKGKKYGKEKEEERGEEKEREGGFI